MPFEIHQLPALNATLNGLATILLIVGFLLIKQRREQAHKWTMLAAFAVSVLFLTSYLIYHFEVRHVPFEGQGAIRPIYFAILISHIILAAIVPFLALLTIHSGLKDRRARHIRLAKWTFPIWLYVSITGVLIYFMLYHLYPAPTSPSKIETAEIAP